MATFKILDPNTKAVIQSVLDGFLANNADGGLAKTCIIVYPPKQVRCNNCVFDPISNKSSNRPLSEAPVPFQPGSSCPLCNGKGLMQTAVEEEITLKCNWTFKKFVNPPGDVRLRLPHSICEIKGFASDLPKLLKADYLLIDIPTMPIIRKPFVLMGEPGDPSSMVPGRYFLSYWERKKN